jgi:hypothetical protein
VLLHAGFKKDGNRNADVFRARWWNVPGEKVSGDVERRKVRIQVVETEYPLGRTCRRNVGTEVQ